MCSAGMEGFEPPTFRFVAGRSNPLSYTPAEHTFKNLLSFRAPQGSNGVPW